LQASVRQINVCHGCVNRLSRCGVGGGSDIALGIFFKTIELKEIQ
jgi:hypothetical protein